MKAYFSHLRHELGGGKAIQGAQGSRELPNLLFCHSQHIISWKDGKWTLSLLCDKLPRNLTTRNKYLFPYSFCGPGIQIQLSRVPLAQGVS